MGKCLQDYFAVNPLEDPIVKSTLGEVQMSGQQLIEMSVKELNKQLAGCSSFVVSKLKKCRRTLKNRGYAKSCRIKRIVAKSELEQVNARLLAELTELRQRNRSLADQVHRLLSATMTTTPASDRSSPLGFAPTGQHQHHMNMNHYEHPPATDGPQHQQKSQIFHQQLPGPSSVVHHNTAAYHGLGHHHQNHHSSGSSTCNSSPVSSLSSGGVDASACRALEVDLDFALDDNQLAATGAGCHHHHAGLVQPADARARSAIYGELPDGWSMGHSISQQQSALGFH